MGRLDKAIQHCKGQVPSLGKRIKRTRLGKVDLKFWEVPRPSWDDRPYAKAEQYSVTNNIDKFSAVELMVSMRGLAVVLREIADDVDIQGNNEKDLKYVAGRLDLLVVTLEQKVRTVGGKYDEDDQ